MARFQLTIATAALLGFLLLGNGEAADQGPATVQLLDLFTAGEARPGLAETARNIIGGGSPEQAVAEPTIAPPSPGTLLERSLETTALRAMGRYVTDHNSEYPHGLPGIDRIKHFYRLQPFFAALLPYGYLDDEYLKKWNERIDEAWLAAAIASGDRHFGHGIPLYRGKLQELLTHYQSSGDEIGLLLLGESLVNHPKGSLKIDPRPFSARTLALLLAGGLGEYPTHPSDVVALIMEGASWIRGNPGIMPIVRELRDDRSREWLEVTILWDQGHRTTALERLFSRTHDQHNYTHYMVQALLSRTNLTAVEFAGLGKRIPTAVLTRCAEQMLDAKSFSNQGEIATWIVSLIVSRNDPDSKKRKWLPMHKARKVALQWWRDGREDEAFKVLKIAFLQTSADSGDELRRFAALAHVFGKEAEVLEELTLLQSLPGRNDFTSHHSAMLTVAGRYSEALPYERLHPTWALHLKLLTVCEKWDQLTSLSSPSSEPDERTRRLTQAVFLNQDSKSAAAYFNGLSDKEKSRTAIFLLLSGNHSLLLEHATLLLSDEEWWHSKDGLIPLFDVLESAIETILNQGRLPKSEMTQLYFDHIDLSRNRQKSLQILERLLKVLPNDSGGWWHQQKLPRSFIELGDVGRGCEGLQQLAREKPDLFTKDFAQYWKSFLPKRFVPHPVYWKLATLEQPDATDWERPMLLSQILADNSVPEACRKMLVLLEKHRSSLSLAEASDLLQSLSAALCGETGADAIQSDARRVFALFQPTELQAAILNSWPRPLPQKERFFSETGFEPGPSDRHDPRAADFQIVDGMWEVRRLLALNQDDAAGKLFLQMEVRMLLDDLRTVEVDARGRTNRGTWGSSSDESLAIPIIAAWCWDLRAPFLRDYALLLWRCGFDDSRYLVESLARNGDFTEARAAALEHQRDGQPRSLDEIRLLPAIHGLADAAEGKVEPALKRLSVCMDLFPFDPRPGMAILGAFRERGRHDVAERATQRIRDHWQQRLLEHPHSIEVSEGARYWLGELERTTAIR